MPLVKINIDGDHIADGPATMARVSAAADALPRGAPVVAMVHGYSFSPRDPARDPHAHILSLTPRADCWKARSWPAGLGAQGGARAPLCLAIGWEARTTPWRAYAGAARAGVPLARVLAAIHARRPDLQIGALAHSMGARVVLSALAHGTPGALARAVLLAPAEMGRAAHDFIETPGGRAADILCVTSRQNAVFEQLLGWTVGPHRVFDRALGHRGHALHPRATNLRLDDPLTCDVLAALGYPLGDSRARVCHWSVYLRAGLFPLYRAVLSGQLPVARLRAALSAATPAPPAPVPAIAPQHPPRPWRMPGLPFGSKASSS